MQTTWVRFEGKGLFLRVCGKTLRDEALNVVNLVGSRVVDNVQDLSESLQKTQHSSYIVPSLLRFVLLLLFGDLCKLHTRCAI